MLSKTKTYVGNKYKHRKQINNLNNSTQEKDKKYKKPVEEKQIQETKTCYACGSKEHHAKRTPTYLSLMKNGQIYQNKS